MYTFLSTYQTVCPEDWPALPSNGETLSLFVDKTMFQRGELDGSAGLQGFST